MNTYIKYEISPDKLKIISESKWYCRNIGLNKIVANVYKKLISNNIIKKKLNLIIHCNDGNNQKINENNTIEFDCVTTNKKDDEIFPDFVFGNWEDIGLTDYDTFVKQIVEKSNSEITDDRLFWSGNLQNVPQREQYIRLSKEFPNLFKSEIITWKGGPQDKTTPIGNFIEIKNLYQFKYLIDLSGVGYSARLKLLTYCGRPLFIADRIYYSWSDIEILKQNLHIPINGNLLDLKSKLLFSEIYYDVFLSKAKELQNFAINNFTFEKACDYAYKLISNKICNTIF